MRSEAAVGLCWVWGTSIPFQQAVVLPKWNHWSILDSGTSLGEFARRSLATRTFGNLPEVSTGAPLSIGQDPVPMEVLCSR